MKGTNKAWKGRKNHVSEEKEEARREKICLEINKSRNDIRFVDRNVTASRIKNSVKKKQKSKRRINRRNRVEKGRTGRVLRRLRRTS